MKVQNYSNHARYFPFLHFFLMPLFLLVLVILGYRTFNGMEAGNLFPFVVIVLLMLTNLAARLQALKAQNRLIRLEEFIRYDRVLSTELAARARDLPVGRIIALRFASDRELPGLVERVLAGDFKDNKELKQAITEWRADLYRV